MAHLAAHLEADAVLAFRTTTLSQRLQETAMLRHSILTIHVHAALHPIHVHAAIAVPIVMQAAIVRAAHAQPAPTIHLAATAAIIPLHVR